MANSICSVQESQSYHESSLSLKLCIQCQEILLFYFKIYPQFNQFPINTPIALTLAQAGIISQLDYSDSILPTLPASILAKQLGHAVSPYKISQGLLTPHWIKTKSLQCRIKPTQTETFYISSHLCYHSLQCFLSHHSGLVPKTSQRKSTLGPLHGLPLICSSHLNTCG